MSETQFIYCPGCSAIVDPTRVACPGCGRCIGCGKQRFEEIKVCSNCDAPYCTCCEKCMECHDFRYQTAEPCSCGHPDDKSKIESLIRTEGINSKYHIYGPVITVFTVIVSLTIGFWIVYLLT